MIDARGTAEHGRLEEADGSGVPWRKWGPYLSERQWGTVREDCSPNGDADDPEPDVDRPDLRAKRRERPGEEQGGDTVGGR